jgi:hypothetical protein
MYLAKYNIGDPYFTNCIILRFSANSFAENDIHVESENINDILKNVYI